MYGGGINKAYEFEKQGQGKTPKFAVNGEHFSCAYEKTMFIHALGMFSVHERECHVSCICWCLTSLSSLLHSSNMRSSPAYVVSTVYLCAILSLNSNYFGCACHLELCTTMVALLHIVIDTPWIHML